VYSFHKNENLPKELKIIFFKFSSKKCRVLCIFIVKNYLCPETQTGGGFINPMGG